MNRDEFLARRMSGIGGSDAAAILGLNPWKTEVEVYLDKRGLGQPAEGLRLRFGDFAEQFVATEYTRETGRRVQRFHGLLRHPEHDFAIGNVDRLVIPDGAKVAAHRGQIRTDRLLECKTSGAHMADTWGPAGTDQIPQHYLVQVAWYQALSGCKYADLAVLIGNNDLRVYHLTRDTDLEAMLFDRIGAWWKRHIVDGEMPDPTNESDVALLFPRSKPDTVVEAGAETLAAIEEFRDIRARIDELEKIEKSLATRVKAAIGEADALSHEGRVLATWRSAKDSFLFDANAFKAAHPDLYQQFLAERAGSRRFLLKDTNKEIT